MFWTQLRIKEAWVFLEILEKERYILSGLSFLLLSITLLRENAKFICVETD